jgi:hypothetical protein
MKTEQAEATWTEYLSTIEAQATRGRQDAKAKLDRLLREAERIRAALAEGHFPRTDPLGPLASEIDALLVKAEWLHRERSDLALLVKATRETPPT